MASSTFTMVMPIKCLPLFAALIVMQIAITCVFMSMSPFGDGDDRALRLGAVAPNSKAMMGGADDDEIGLVGGSSTATATLPLGHRSNRGRRRGGGGRRRQGRLTVESYVMSLTQRGADAFLARHAESDEASSGALWFLGVNGMDQSVLDGYADMIGKYPPLNASRFSPRDKDDFKTPHYVGNLLAHIHLLRYLEHRREELRPDLWFVFEDDAMCVPNLTASVADVVSALPSDWDVLFVGGKPYTQYPDDHSAKPSGMATTETKVVREMNETSFRSEACAGAYGRGQSPLAPDGSRKLSVDQPYWRVLDLTDTLGYVINPASVSRVLDVIRTPRDYIPVDIMLAAAMSDGRIKVYIPTLSLCGGHGRHDAWRVGSGVPWEGWHVVPYLRPVNWWGPMSFEECSGSH